MIATVAKMKKSLLILVPIMDLLALVYQKRLGPSENPPNTLKMKSPYSAVDTVYEPFQFPPSSPSWFKSCLEGLSRNLF
jgi:hypothetical protein